MAKRAILSACAATCACLWATVAGANMASMNERWFHDMTQDERDVSFQIQLIEEDPPNFDTTFKLVRDAETLFEHKQFVREEADEVVGPGCIEIMNYDYYEIFDDCDEDGIPECAGVCGTAYRYEYVDECVPDDSVMYTLWDESTFDENGNPPATGPESEGAWYIFDLQPTDDSCLGTGDSGCSVTGVPGSTSEGALAALMLLAGLGFAVVAGRRRNH